MPVLARPRCPGSSSRQAYAPAGATLSELVAVARAVSDDGVAYVRSIFVPEDETCFHLFESVSPGAVSALTQRAGLGTGRVVEAIEAP